MLWTPQETWVFVLFLFGLHFSPTYYLKQQIKSSQTQFRHHVILLCACLKNGLMDEITRVRGPRVETDHGARGSKAMRMRVDHLYLRIKGWGPLGFM